MITRHTKRTCDVCSEDLAFVERFNEQVRMLTGMVKEMVVDEPRVLLSPVMRRLLADKAAEVESLHAPLRHRMVVDNPGEPLQPAPRA